MHTAPQDAPGDGTARSAGLTADEIDRIRRDFPILDTEVNGHPLVYLDSAATSQKPRQVLDAERAYLELRNSAVHRGAHTLAALATEEFEEAREKVARFVGVDASEIVWTSNATEGINLVAYGLGSAAAPESVRVREGDEIVVTESEHHANLIPWQQLALRTGAALRFIPVDDAGALRLETLGDVITDRTRVVALAHVSNVLGGIAQLGPVIARAREVGALVVLDACQSVPHLPVDLRALDVDLAVFSGHKMLAPTGIGVLYGRRRVLEALPPFLTGGSMITTVTMEAAEFLPPPQRFEAGTQRISQVVALGVAVEYLEAVGMDRIAEHGRRIGARLVSGLSGIRGVRVLGSGADGHRVGLAAFDLAGVHAHDVGQILDDRGIAVRVGHHCAQPLHRRLGLTASTRASGTLHTTDAEIDLLLQGVEDAAAFFGAGR
ncbi:SufS family cysteine desulfurase [Clavibacter sepedonicus]|uniref:Cysteine desulfurase n=1 Tax=Clavibacter sepedonicus TaxID=31964 RepID=B0RG87_CLASE|nr:SufS family cysteine desulfurase [Clavibacter sepedonicus]OQJ47974.1 cysteine desulfurase [Clavibacter sepedonicus]OQJ53529.1 cysteine desulfurase [Clavibacter sepedonicus]UUK66361.1 SufS family cysteine desulfurase [Clavibacter sepedonicus]CAQ02379.1 cysteine desulfurase [Clavibacter sepedonicus]